MKQLACILLVFSSFHLFADPGHGLAAYYNGETFPCNNAKIAEQNAKAFASAGGIYNHALCRAHRGELSEAISLFTLAADGGEFNGKTIKGRHPIAATELAYYYGTDGFKLKETTKNTEQLQRAIDYYKKALKLMAQPSYLANSDHRRGEEEQGRRSLTANRLVATLMTNAIAEFEAHINGYTNRNDNSTLQSLHEVKAAAQSCLTLKEEGNFRLWPSAAVFNKRMKFCEEKIAVLEDSVDGEGNVIREGLLSLEARRLHIANTECKFADLYECLPHREIGNQMIALFTQNIIDGNKLLLASR